MTGTKPVAIGVDVGTTHVKVLALGLGGEILAVGRTDTPVGTDGIGPVHDAQALETVVVRLVHDVLERTCGVLTAIAAASMGEEGFWLDAHNEVLYPSLAWYAPRPTAQFVAFAREHGGSAYERAGILADPIRTLAHWMWLAEHRPDVLAHSTSWLPVSEYLAFRWSGVKVLSRSQASRTLVWDLGREEASGDCLEDLGLRPESLPPVVGSGTILGPLRKDAFPGLARVPDARVVVAGHDHPVGAFAVGVTGAGQVLDSLGTAESLMLPMATARPEAWMMAEGLEFGASCQGLRHYAMVAGHSGAHLKAWTGIVGSDPSRLEEEAREVPPGSLGLSLIPPGWRTGDPGALLGLGPTTESAVLYRALLEGWAFWARQSLDRLERVATPGLAGLGSRPITAIGGGSQRPLAMEIRAATIGRPIDVCDSSEAVALGCARLAQEAASPGAPAPAVPCHRVLPDPALRHVYDRLYERWLGLPRPGPGVVG